MSEAPPSPERLDSWKAIAEYLQRDVATVRRWEKALGLPIHRVGGTGRSVFSYTSEIDEWLNRAKPLLPVLDPLLPALEPLLSPAAPRRSTTASVWLWAVLAVAVVASVTAVLVTARWTTDADANDVRVEVTSAGVIARDSAGTELWRHAFDATYRTFLPAAPADPVRVIAGASPGVYVLTSHRGRQTENQVEGGVLTLLDIHGRPQRSFSPDDNVTFQGKSYGPPWALTAFDVDTAHGTPRVALAAHHYTWGPSLVTIMDGQWRRRGTFVHAGWIELVRWVGAERLLIGGFSDAHDGGMLAVLDAAAIDGQGPEPAGSPHFCESCGASRPVRMYVFPRTELNRLTASRFNRVIVTTTAHGPLIAQTIEATSADGDAAAVYEFTSSLDLVGARLNERYWEMHRAFEGAGRITHSRDQCPDREGPRQIQMWDPAAGWQNASTR